MRIAIVQFQASGQDRPPVDLRNVIASDLYRSGDFEILPPEDFLSRPSNDREVRYRDWRFIKADALVVGGIKALGGDRFEVRFQLFDVFREKQLAGYRWEVDATRLRKIAHQTSDHIVKALIGKGPAFDSRIAYVTVQNKSDQPTYKLMVAESDGFDPRELLLSNDPILSPAWSPDGRYLAYVSFEDGWSKIVIQEINTGNRIKVSEYPGMNGAPAWSPDGRRLAMSLSHEGNSEIYVMDIKNRQLQRLTYHAAIDTEPSWAPNGRSIIFTSDRSGRPQIYRVPTAGKKVVRVTFEGRENSRASFSPDGKNLLMVTNNGNGRQIGIFSLSDKRMRTLTKGPSDESPTFAPNGSMALYATERGGRELLEIVSVDGGNRQELQFQQGTVRSPVWSPVNR
jgi:TolB protein